MNNKLKFDNTNTGLESQTIEDALVEIKDKTSDLDKVVATFDTMGIDLVDPNAEVPELPTPTVTKSGTYGFKVSTEVAGGQAWESENVGVDNSSAIAIVTFPRAISEGEIEIHYIVSSESNFDKLTIEVGDTTIVNGISGEQSGVKTPAIPAGTRVKFTYSKDGSSRSGSDKAIFWFSQPEASIDVVMLGKTLKNIDDIVDTDFFSYCVGVDKDNGISSADKKKLKIFTVENTFIHGIGSGLEQKLTIVNETGTYYTRVNDGGESTNWGSWLKIQPAASNTAHSLNAYYNADEDAALSSSYTDADVDSLNEPRF